MQIALGEFLKGGQTYGRLLLFMPREKLCWENKKNLERKVLFSYLCIPL